jgi:hypothetical protein
MFGVPPLCLTPSLDPIDVQHCANLSKSLPCGLVVGKSLM